MIKIDNKPLEEKFFWAIAIPNFIIHFLYQLKQDKTKQDTMNDKKPEKCVYLIIHSLYILDSALHICCLPCSARFLHPYNKDIEPTNIKYVVYLLTGWLHKI